MKRVSKDEWLQAALDTLIEEGVEALRIERLAKRLHISKSGFYWHFKDSADLRQQIVEYWEHEYTETVINLLGKMPMEPKQKLQYIAQMVLENKLATYDIAMQALGKREPALMRRINKVYKVRTNFVRKLFEELGFKGDELELRTRLFVVYHSFELLVPGRGTKKELLAQIPARVELLTRKGA